MDSVDVTTFSEADDAPTKRLSVTARRGPVTEPVPASSLPAAAGAKENRCAECGAPMASDQRYCVECGERRGEPRFPAMLNPPGRAPSSPSPPRRSRPRLSPNSTLIAGVGTLLLAMGVGVLIGRSGSSSSSHPPSGVQVVTVGGGSTTSAPTGATGITSGTAGTAQSGSKSATVSKSKTTKATAVKLPPPVVKIGSKGTGKGYKNGHFTGEFFGSEEE